MIEYIDKTDEWIGTPIEHLKKLLETHDCLCDKAKLLIKKIIEENIK